MEPTIKSVQRTVHLIMKANCENFASVAETAREMKISKTALMAFIEEHPKHFRTVQRSEKKIRNGLIVGTKNLGLVIKGVYESPDQNPYEKEYLERLISENRRTILVLEYEEYGQHLCWHLPEDLQQKDSCGRPVTDNDNRKNTFLWRNTPQKLQEIAAAGHAREDCVWGGGDGRSRIGFKYMVNADDLRALRAEGWTIDGGPDPSKY